MANALVILRTTGPLPLQAQFTAPSDGPAILFVSGSGWSGNGASSIGAQVAIDGAGIGVVGVYTNEASSHKAFIPMMFPVQLSYGAHTLTLTQTATTTTDSNDVFEVVLLS